MFEGIFVLKLVPNSFALDESTSHVPSHVLSRDKTRTDKEFKAGEVQFCGKTFKLMEKSHVL